MYTGIKYQVLLLVLLCVCIPVFAGETDQNNCYPITLKDISDENAPKFEQYPAEVVQINSPAPVDIYSHPLAKTYRTVIRREASKGPNFAGHYTVAIWGAGSSTVAFAIVDALNGKVIVSNEASIVYFGPRFELEIEEDFLPDIKTEAWSLFYKLDSRLFVIVGTLGEDENREGAFYYILEDNNLKLIHSVTVKKQWCDREEVLTPANPAKHPIKNDKCYKATCHAFQ